MSSGFLDIAIDHAAAPSGRVVYDAPPPLAAPGRAAWAGGSGHIVNDQGFSRHLFDGEQLLWSGRPPLGLRLTWRDIVLVPLSLFFATFAGTMFRDFWVTSSQDVIFLIMAAYFTVAMAFFVFGRLLFDIWLRLRTRYAVTDRRVLIFRKGPPSAQAYLTITDLPEVTLVEHRGDRGTIWFGPKPGLFGLNRGAFSFHLAIEWRALTPSLAPDHLFAIDDARRVFDMLQSRRARTAT